MTSLVVGLSVELELLMKVSDKFVEFSVVKVSVVKKEHPTKNVNAKAMVKIISFFILSLIFLVF
jgi:hypothetical protein